MGMLAWAYPMFGTTGTFFTGSQVVSSSSLHIKYTQGYSVQFATSANSGASSTIGTVSLLGSNDNINFVPINGTTAFMSSTGSVLINVGQAYYKYLQANFSSSTPSSGFVVTTFLSKSWGT
jgi:hypothetical protein